MREMHKWNDPPQGATGDGSRDGPPLDPALEAALLQARADGDMHSPIPRAYGRMNYPIPLRRWRYAFLDAPRKW